MAHVSFWSSLPSRDAVIVPPPHFWEQELQTVLSDTGTDSAMNIIPCQ